MNTKIILGISLSLITLVLIIVFTRNTDNRFENEINKIAPDSSSKFLVVSPQGDLVLTGKTASQFANDINSRDNELISDYETRDKNFWPKAAVNSTVGNLTNKINEIIDAQNSVKNTIGGLISAYNSGFIATNSLLSQTSSDRRNSGYWPALRGAGAVKYDSTAGRPAKL